MAEKSTDSTAKSNEPTTAAEAQAVEGLTVPTDVEKKPAGSKAYVSDRNLAEVNAGEVVYLDPKSETGKRLLATGYFEEVEDPLA